MIKKSFLQKAAVFALLIAAISCEQEPLQISGVTCGGCPTEFDPGGGTVVIYCPDLIVNSVISYGREGNVVKYGVAIKNIGNITAAISNTNLVGWQAYLSKDGVTRNLAACGSSFNQPLEPGQIAVKSINCTFPSYVNLNDYRSMIVVLQVPSAIQECSSSNNTFVRTPPPY